MPNILDLLEDGAQSRAYFRTVPTPSDVSTVTELWQLSERAGRFLAHRCGPGSAVGMLLGNSAECIATLVGGWRAGLCVASLPAPPRAMAMPDYLAQMAAACRQLEIRVLVVTEELAPTLATSPFTVLTFPQAVTGGPPAPMHQSGSFVQFTSGSTATPKGVLLTMEAIGANVEAIIDRMGPPDPTVSCSWLPLSHDMGLIGMCLAPWASQSRVSGGGLCLLDPALFLRRPEAWLSTCSKLRATATAGPNFALDLTVRRPPNPDEVDLRSLAVFVVGAEPVRADTLRRYTEAVAPCGFDDRALCPAFGMAEATLAISIASPGTRWSSAVVDRAALESGRWAERVDSDDGYEVVALGQLLPGMEIAVDRPDPGSVGELRVRGPSMFERYVAGPSSRTADGWFATRDLGTVSDGQLYVTGRADDMMVIAGRNFFPHDLEDAAASVAGVRRFSTAAVPFGSGYAMVIERPKGWDRGGDGKAFCRNVRIAVAERFGIGPVAVFVVRPGTFPRTPSGKPQRKRLASQLVVGALPIDADMHFR